ncbi:MAG: HPr kinase/phosphorylase, partial [Oscillospiraceae bacterium]|nr:HPr kinase/phosphorylase [Oscillospiraceae bacterium]
MDKRYFVRLERIIEEFSLEVVYGGENYQDIRIYVDSVDRPGLQLVGYFDHFESQRIQLIGNMEYGYLEELTPEQRNICFEQLFHYDIPAL